MRRGRHRDCVRLGGFGRFIVGVVLSACILTFMPSCRRLGTGPSPADNSDCLVCHLNYAMETFAEGHRQSGIGCVRCHGDSEAHTADETSCTPPDRMYSPRNSGRLCLKCHMLKRLRPECARDVDSKGCTGCHDSHRLNERTRRWDKRTGELIYKSEEEGMDQM